MYKLSVFIFSFIFWQGTYQVGAENPNVTAIESDKCVDKLSNCAALVSRGICNPNRSFSLGKQCARSCALCRTTSVVRVRRASNYRRRFNSRARSNATKPRPRANSWTRVQARKPASRTRNRRPASKTQSRRPTASRSRVQNRRPTASKRRPVSRTKASRSRAQNRRPTASKRRPVSRTKASKSRAQARKPTASKRRPTSRIKARKPAQKSNVRTRQSSPRTSSHQQAQTKTRTHQQQAASKPRAVPTTVGNSQPTNFKPIGPNQIRINNDVMLSSQMQQTKRNAIVAGKDFDELKGDIDGIIQDLDETLKQMDEEEKGQVSKIQMDFNDVHLFQPMFKSGHGFRSYNTLAKHAANRGNKSVQNARGADQKTQNLFEESRREQGLAGGNGRKSRLQLNYAVFPVQNRRSSSKSLVAYDFNQLSSDRRNLAQTLGSFATDFEQISKKLKKFIEETASSTKELEGIIRAVDYNEINTQQAKLRVQKVRSEFLKIKDELKETTDLFKTTRNDYAKVADDFDKTKSDPPTTRKPASEDPTRKWEANTSNGDSNQSSTPNQTPINSEIPRQDQQQAGSETPKQDEQPKPETQTEAPKPDEPKGEKVTIECGKLDLSLQSAQDVNNPVTCKSGPPANQGDNVFRVDPAGGNENVKLFSERNKRYCEIGNETAGKLVCNSPTGGTVFKKVQNTDGKISFQCENQLYLTMDERMNNMLQCYDDKISDITKFLLVSA